jgi:hypothetical protein
MREQGSISGVNMTESFFMDGKDDRKLSTGIKPGVVAMRKLSNFIRDVFASGIPGYPNIPTLQWAERYGKGLISHNLVQAWINQKRVPSLDTLIMFGILLKECGAVHEDGTAVEPLDPLLYAADGVYADLVLQLKGQIANTELGDYSHLGKPEEGEIAHPVDYPVRIYQQQNYDDRIAAMPELLKAISRDLRYQNLDNFQTVRELVREVKLRNGNDSNRLAALADVPKQLIDLIVEGKLEEIKAMSDVGMILKLSERVPNLNGETSKAELFSCLLPSPEVKALAKALKRQQRNGAVR